MPRRRLVVGVALVCLGLLLGVLSAALYVHSRQSEEARVPMYERNAADLDACRVAEVAIAGHRAPAPTVFAGSCELAVVTHIWPKPGYVIVTRTLKDAESSKFSALLDGRQTDRWRLVDVKPTANELALDAPKQR